MCIIKWCVLTDFIDILMSSSQHHPLLYNHFFLHLIKMCCIISYNICSKIKQIFCQYTVDIQRWIRCVWEVYNMWVFVGFFFDYMTCSHLPFKTKLEYLKSFTARCAVKQIHDKFSQFLNFGLQHIILVFPLFLFLAVCNQDMWTNVTNVTC